MSASDSIRSAPDVRILYHSMTIVVRRPLAFDRRPVLRSLIHTLQCMERELSDVAKGLFKAVTCFAGKSCA